METEETTEEMEVDGAKEERAKTPSNSGSQAHVLVIGATNRSASLFVLSSFWHEKIVY